MGLFKINPEIIIAPQIWWGLGIILIGTVTKIMHSVFMTRGSGFTYFQTKEGCDERIEVIKADIKEIKADQKVIATDIKEILKNGRK